MTSTLTSERVQTVLARLHERARIEDPQAKQRVQTREAQLGARLPPPDRYELYGDAPLAITPEVGELYYVLVTARRAERVVEYGARAASPRSISRARCGTWARTEQS